MNIEITLEELLKNGSHFGHNKKRWNPKMGKFIYGEKNGTHILDLRKSLTIWMKKDILRGNLLNSGFAKTFNV